LALVRAQGYALDRGETLPDVWCFGAPVRDANGSVVAALSISVPVTRIDPMRVETLTSAAQQAARDLSQRLGWSSMTISAEVVSEEVQYELPRRNAIPPVPPCVSHR
ncbi:MAG: hypothetical protein NZ562_05830, partial [Thermomicrobium sp.]|nr:hypothetical protein [Thermomicrobium sp.]